MKRNTAGRTSDCNGLSKERQALFVDEKNKVQKAEKFFCLSSFLEYLKSKTAETCKQVAAIGPHLACIYSAPALRVGGLCPAQHRSGIASPGYDKKVTEYG
ncbi:hypothetical protein [Pseudomonas sp. 8Z]|uniref:hypothetical protein n=1 Tax=Pseudomonas sp. 8Z TaxID=2653166 RepID=UPI00135BF2FF|nr:hypothetical protein [Pseudomonas sp. 8Z]